MYDAAYWQALRDNEGDTPHRADESRFWEMLEVLPPANWHRGQHFECFMVPECQTANLYTWLVRLGKHDPEFWEMIAPGDFMPGHLLARIETAKRVTK
jgi:hypothetical protein